MNKIISLILARGGSKGIPNKNIIDINGKPLIEYSIKAASLSKANDVWVSTNCKKIANISSSLGAKIIMRPEALCTDKSKSEEALLHFSDMVSFDILVFIQPTSPLLQYQDINNALEMIDTYDSVFSAYKEHWIPRWTYNKEPDNWDINNRPMRQDMPEKYVENGALYITKKEALLTSGCRYSGKIGIVEMPFYRSFQIDTQDDLDFIRQIIRT